MAGHIIYVNATIPATPEQVWGVITDVARADQVLRSVTASELLEGDGFDVGTVWRESRTVFGHRGTEELHVVECHPPRRALVETRLGRDTVRTAYSLTSSGTVEGQTRLSMTTTAVMSERSRLGALTWKFFGELPYQATRRMLQRDLADIAAEVARRGGGEVAVPAPREAPARTPQSAS